MTNEMLSQGYIAGVAAIGLLMVVDSVVLARRGGVPGRSNMVVSTIEFAWAVASGVLLFIGLAPTSHWLALGFLAWTGAMLIAGFAMGSIGSASETESPQVMRLPLALIWVGGAIGCVLAAAGALHLLMPEAAADYVEQNDALLSDIAARLLRNGYPVVSLAIGLAIVADAFDLTRRNGIFGRTNDTIASVQLLWAGLSMVMLFLDIDPGLYWLAAAQVAAFLIVPVGALFIVGIVSSQNGGPFPSPIRMPLAAVWMAAAMGVGTAGFAALLLLAPSAAGGVVGAGASVPLDGIRASLWPIDRTLAIRLSMVLAIAVVVKAFVLLDYLVRASRAGLPLTFEGGLLRHMARPASVLVQIVLMFEFVWLFYAVAHQMFLDHLYAQAQVYWGIIYLSLGYFLFRQMTPRFAPDNRFLPFLATAADIAAAIAFFALLTRLA